LWEISFLLTEKLKVWDANRNTDEFVSYMEEWRKYGLLAITLNLQGGSSMGYGNSGWINSAFDYFDYRLKDEGFESGFQSMPVNWGINSERKKMFFNKLREITLE
jgi:hypothetical protein